MYVVTETVPLFSAQAFYSQKAVAVFPVWTSKASVFVMAAVAVLFGLFVLAYCHMQHLSRFGTLRSAVGANGKSVVVTIGGYALGDVEVQMVSGEDGPGADMVASASAPPAAYFPVSAAPVPSAEAYLYINTETVSSSGQASSTQEALAFFSVWTISAIVVMAVALLVLLVVAYCFRQYLCRCGTSRVADGANGKSVVVTIGGYDLGDVEVQMVSGGEDGGADNIEMMRMSLEQGGQDPSLEIGPGADMVAAAAAPPAAYFTESAVAVPTAAVDYYATTTAHCEI
eukprot:gene7551-5429_t